MFKKSDFMEIIPYIYLTYPKSGTQEIIPSLNLIQSEFGLIKN